MSSIFIQDNISHTFFLTDKIRELISFYIVNSESNTQCIFLQIFNIIHLFTLDEIYLSNFSIQ